MPAANKRWHDVEETALRIGIARHGPGRWHAIKHDLELREALAQRSNVDLKDKWRNIRLAASKRKMSCDLPRSFSDTAFGLALPAPAGGATPHQGARSEELHLRPPSFTLHLPPPQQQPPFPLLPPPPPQQQLFPQQQQQQQQPFRPQPVRIAAPQPACKEHTTGPLPGSANGLQALSRAAETLNAMHTLERQHSAPPLPLGSFGGSISGSGGRASETGRSSGGSGGGFSSGHNSGFSSGHSGGSSTSSDSWDGAGGDARMSAASLYSRAAAADNATSPHSGGSAPDAALGPRPNAFATLALPPKKAGRFRRWLGRASGSADSTAALSSGGGAFSRWSAAASTPGWAAGGSDGGSNRGCRSAQSMPSPLSRGNAVCWSAFEVAAEAAVAAERARRAAAGPGAKLEHPQNPPQSPVDAAAAERNPFLAAAAADAQAAAVVTLPGGRQSSGAEANPFAAAAWPRQMLSQARSMSIAEAGSFGSVSEPASPQGFPSGVARLGTAASLPTRRPSHLSSPQQQQSQQPAPVSRAASDGCIGSGGLAGCDAAALGRILRAACAGLDAAAAGTSLRAGVNASAADAHTGRTPLHELAAAAAAAEVLGPSRAAAAGFILNMLLHAGVQVDARDAAGVTPAQLAAGSTFAALLPASTSTAAAPASAGQPCSTGAIGSPVGAPPQHVSPQNPAAKTPPHLIVPPPQQQDAWHSFQRRSLDGAMDSNDGHTNGRSASRSAAAAAAGSVAAALSQPLVGAFVDDFADGFEASPRPRQRRSLDTHRLSLCTQRMQSYTNDPSTRASLDGGAGCRDSGTTRAAPQIASRSGFQGPRLPPASAAAAAAEVGGMLFGRQLRPPAGHPAAGGATGSATARGGSSSGSGDIVMAPAVSNTFSNAFATAGARMSPPVPSPAIGNGGASSGRRIVSGRGYNPAFEASAAAAMPPHPAPSLDHHAVTNSGGGNTIGIMNGGGSNCDSDTAAPGSMVGAAADTPQLLALATQALNVLAMHQQHVAPVFN